MDSGGELREIYERRFTPALAYRKRVWRILVADFFQEFVPADATVIEIGCGYGEFINEVRARRKYALDMNPGTAAKLASDVTFLEQDSSAPWNLPDGSLDFAFSSNFFEHLPDKASLGRTFDEVLRCLRTGGRLVALGPNIRFVPGAYWDFWDHHIPLSERSLSEALATRGFTIEIQRDRFLPYTMVDQRPLPDALLRLYLKCPWLWRFFGKQFLVVAVKSAPPA